MANFDFIKLPFFRNTYNAATTINKKFLKNVSVLTLALLSACFSRICVAFIFFAGLNKFIAQIILENPDIRNLFISIVHTFASLFAILYASFYIDKKRYDGKIVSPAIFTVIIFTINMFLAWRCYFLNDLDILVYIFATDGIMLSIFLLFLSILQYDVVSKKTSHRHMSSSTIRVLSIISACLFAFSIFTYYDYFSSILTIIAHTSLSAFQTDALVLFLFMLSELILIVTIVLMFTLERKLNVMLKEFTDRVRNRTK